MGLKFKMRRDRNAISEFSVRLSFFKPVTSATFASVRMAAEKVAQELGLPTPIQQRVLQFAVGPTGPLPVAPPQLATPADGFGFQGFSRSGEIETSFICEPDNIIMLETEYKGWDHALERIERVFGPLANEYITEVPAIKSFVVQYVNEFRSEAPGLHSVDEIVRPSKWLPQVAVGANDQWHAHTGIFTNLSENSRSLVNVNYDINLGSAPDRPEQATYVKITIVSAINFDIVGRPPLLVKKSDLSQALRMNFGRAHDIEKSTLQEIVSDSYLEMMAKSYD